MKKHDPNDPLRPRNIRKRTNRNAREQHKKLMAEKKEIEDGSVPANSPADTGKKKIFHADTVKEVKQRIARMKETITLPFCIKSLKRGKTSKVLVLNIDGKQRELLPDSPGRHVVLCHGPVAKIIVSGVCVFNKVTQHEQIIKSTVSLADGTDSNVEHREWIDGSWTIAPCTPAMLRGTTVQHVRRRPFWFLRRYWYEISFDGRVQPASMFYDYDIDPIKRRHSFYATHEFVKVKNSDHENDFIRFWKHKDNIHTGIK